MSRDQWPPGGQDGEGRSSPRPATVEQSDNCITHADKLSRQCSSKTQPSRRRRDAALRMPPLDCGCRDPLLHQVTSSCHHRCTTLSERMIDGGRAAALHLLETGHLPILRFDTLRALYRRGGDDRRLAQELYELAGGNVA